MLDERTGARSSMSDRPVVSTPANDPAMRRLVEEFVADLPRRVAAIEYALAEPNLERVRYLSHQIKGSAGTFGCASISRAAALLEDRVRHNAGIEDLRASVKALATLCASLVAGEVRLAPSGG